MVKPCMVKPCVRLVHRFLWLIFPCGINTESNYKLRIEVRHKWSAGNLYLSGGDMYSTKPLPSHPLTHRNARLSLEASVSLYGCLIKYTDLNPHLIFFSSFDFYRSWDDESLAAGHRYWPVETWIHDEHTGIRLQHFQLSNHKMWLHRRRRCRGESS